MRRCDSKRVVERDRRVAGTTPSSRALGRIITAPNGRDRAATRIYETDGEVDMAAIETIAQRAKRELDLQLDEELEGTFPASDPPKITRFSAKSRVIADRQRKSATVPKDES